MFLFLFLFALLQLLYFKLWTEALLWCWWCCRCRRCCCPHFIDGILCYRGQVLLSEAPVSYNFMMWAKLIVVAAAAVL